jgi:UDP-glucose 4-epimerase
MNCLVLGGTGFIGTHLVNALITAGARVRVFSKDRNRFYAPRPDVEYLYGDWANTGMLDVALRGCDYVFHLISTTVPGTANTDPIFDLRSNVLNSVILLQRCAVHNIKKVVFSSSGGTVYGIAYQIPIPESHATEPICAHGIGKLMIEKYIALFHRLYGLDYAIFRTANAYGEGQDPLGVQGVIAVFLGKVARGESITLWGSKDVVRDYIHVEDVARAFVQAVDRTTRQRIFNVGSGQGTSLRELVGLIAEVTDRNPTVVEKSERSWDVPANVLDITRIRTETGWEPQVGLREGLERTWAWIRSLNAEIPERNISKR